MDVHKRVIQFCRLDGAGDVAQEGRFAASREALERFLEEHVGSGGSHLGFEASGSMLWVYDLLVQRYGAQRVHVAQPRRVRTIAASQEKNDRNDAYWLAYFTHQGLLPEAFVPTGPWRELRYAARERMEAVHRRTRGLVRLKGHLTQMGHALSSRLLRTQERWEELAEVARQTPGILRHVLEGLMEEIEAAQRVVARWDAQIAAMGGDLPEVNALAEQIPGIGRVLAAVIVAEAGPIRRFRTAKAFARYAGITPGDRSTGGRTIHGPITRQGSRYLRWALTQAAMACLRARGGAGKAIGDWIRAHERRGRGRARVAAARKLAEGIWRFFTWGECFDAARPFRPMAAGATA